MSYQARVYKVFIASPSDVMNEREVVRSVIDRWNSINSESKRMILQPVGWDTHGAPESGITAQEYINESILNKCDILIGVFWTKIGSPTKNYPSGTVEEIDRHVNERKLAMLYFSKKSIPYDTDISQLDMVKRLKEKYGKESLYGEFADEKDLEYKLYNHLQIKIEEGRFRPVWDSDILANISDDEILVEQINTHFPLVAKNLLINIMDQNKSDIVWDSIIDKLVKSPADLRDILILMAKRGAFKHRAYIRGYKSLAKYSQHDFGNFINNLYTINKFEFYDIYQQGLLNDGPFAQTLADLISKQENI